MLDSPPITGFGKSNGFWETPPTGRYLIQRALTGHFREAQLALEKDVERVTIVDLMKDVMSMA